MSLPLLDHESACPRVCNVVDAHEAIIACGVYQIHVGCSYKWLGESEYFIISIDLYVCKES